MRAVRRSVDDAKHDVRVRMHAARPHVALGAGVGLLSTYAVYLLA